MKTYTLVGMALSFLSGLVITFFTRSSDKTIATKEKTDANIKKHNRDYSNINIETIGWEKHFNKISKHNNGVNIVTGILLSAGFAFQIIGFLL